MEAEISNLQSMGFTLDQIADLIRAQNDGETDKYQRMLDQILREKRPKTLTPDGSRMTTDDLVREVSWARNRNLELRNQRPRPVPLDPILDLVHGMGSARERFAEGGQMSQFVFKVAPTGDEKTVSKAKLADLKRG
jgi:DNA-binding transcriptional MerR regulator